MPTLVTKNAFGPESAFQPDMSGLQALTATPPRHMRDVRAAMQRELKSLTKLLQRVEKAYYGERGNINNEVEHYVYSVKMLMKSLMIFDLNNTAAVDDMIKLASNPSRYTGEPKYLKDLKEIYIKVQTFLPDRLSEIVDRCQTLLDRVHRYCVSFYDPETDCYLETADHYSEQIGSWIERAQSSIQSVRSLYQRFRTSGVTIKMLSSPVEKFASRNSLQRVLFVVLFADACTHLRNVIEVMRAWVKADENYSSYVKNDLNELDSLKEDKVRDLRECRQKSHGLTYKLTQQEVDYSRLAADVNSLREKEGSLRIEEVHLANLNTDTEREIEIKERRRDQLRHQSPVHGPAPSPEPNVDTVESLTHEIKALKEKLPLLARQIAAVRLKRTWIDDKMGALDRLSHGMLETKRELKQVDIDRARREKEYSEVERAVDVAKRVLMCKTASDSVEKLYYKVPMAARAARVVKSKEEGNIADPVDRACAIICKRIERDWTALYRALPFHPIRGSETISQDIVDLTQGGARGAYALVARRALDRWRRYHTRSSVEDLRQALRKIRRLDILKTVDLILTPPAKVITAPFEVVEEPAPPVEAHLIPFYKQIERYDQIRANRLAAEAEAERRRMAKLKAA
ncbi:uncharacterized protein LOC101862992 [Aplysia californica]|uniref:Uncharacterized protein LOC101862992 n=1 Tax=Aplysia californica TaxID=6500 RepID=A0ABM0JDA2_APLCA|nr:uncharacterized protein LOC101862992 [Aplysia californica]